jgi:hypothetical protein
VLISIASLPITRCAPSHPLSSPSPHLPLPFSSNISPDHLPPTHSSLTNKPTVPTLYNPKCLQSLKQTPSTTEIQPNIHKDHKNQQPPHCFPYSPTTLPISTFSATLSNSPNLYS